MNTFYQFCVSACVFLLFITMSINFVNMLNVFPSTLEGGFVTGNTTASTYENLTATNSTSYMSMGDIWTIVGVGALIGGIALAILTQSVTIIGAYLFGLIFWSSYLNVVGILFIGGAITGALVILMSMVTIGMVLLFAGAIIGMFTGSG